MRFTEIKELIAALYDYPDKTEFDLNFSQEINYRFSSKSDDYLCTQDDLSFIKALYQQRWLKVFDTRLDYTAKIDGINQLWINLAEKFAEHTPEKSTIRLLFPTLNTDLDPNNFKKISENQECLELFVGEDDSLYLILSFIEHLFRKKLQLSTYRKNNRQRDSFSLLIDESRIYPISIRELSRFKRSTGKALKLFDEEYSNLWDFLNQRVFPNMQKYGEIPTAILPSFLTLVGCYFDNKKQANPYQDFRKELEIWIDCLLECSVQDVNKLYGIKIPYKEQETYLFELLIDIYDACDYTIDDQLQALTQCFVVDNPSYAIAHHSLDSIYQKNGLGPFFSLEEFKQLLSECLDQDGLHTKILKKMTILLSLAEDSKTITSEMIEQLAMIYRLRWDHIVNSELDYTRLQTGENQPWIRLAQQLVGAGLLEENYYGFLMPTLISQNKTATGEPLINYPLSHYVLSDNHDQLILLDDCVKQHMANGTFYHWKDDVAIPLSAREISRMKYAAPSFLVHYNRASSNLATPSISMKTIEQLNDLLRNIIRVKGLYSGKYYNDREMSLTAESLVVFFQAIPREERERLNQQIIIHAGKKKSFSEVWHGIENDECITLLGKYLLQLLMNYAPYIVFSPEFEDEFRIKEMREQSAELVFSDYEELTQSEIEQNCQLFYISIMTHSFQMLPLCGKDVEFLDCKNIVNEEGKKIHHLLNPMFQSGDFSKARYLYAQIVEGIIKPGMKKHSLLTRLKSRDKTDRWLINLKDGKILGHSYQVYEVEQLLKFALTLHYKKSLPCGKLIDELIRTSVQDLTELNLKLRANIVFLKYFESLPNELMHSLLKKLTNREQLCQKQSVYGQCRNYLVQQLNLCHRPSSPKAIFFTTDGKQEMDKSDAKNTDDDSFNSMHTVLEDIRQISCSSSQSLGLKKYAQAYLARIMEPIFVDRLMEHLNSIPLD